MSDLWLERYCWLKILRSTGYVLLWFWHLHFELNCCFTEPYVACFVGLWLRNCSDKNIAVNNNNNNNLVFFKPDNVVAGSASDCLIFELWAIAIVPNLSWTILVLSPWHMYAYDMVLPTKWNLIVIQAQNSVSGRSIDFWRIFPDFLNFTAKIIKYSLCTWMICWSKQSINIWPIYWLSDIQINHLGSQTMESLDQIYIFHEQSQSSGWCCSLSAVDYWHLSRVFLHDHAYCKIDSCPDLV